MSMENIIQQIRVLIGLAQVDGNFHEREKQLILRMGRKHKLDEEKVKALIAESKTYDPSSLKDLNYEEKFEVLYQLIVMMKADNSVMDEEVVFIQRIAKHLGFEFSVIMELYTHIRSNIRDPLLFKTLRKEMKDRIVAKE